MNKEKLHKFTLNQLSDNRDVEEVVNWIEASKVNKEEFETIKNLWAISGFANYNSYVGSKQTQTAVNSRKRIIPFTLLKYAAVFVLALLIGSLSIYFIGSEHVAELALNEIIVPNGESAEVCLSDNTHVWLNSGSTLVYPANFKGKYRNVQLTGEAYFEVTHNPDKPFHVETPELTVKVLGTSFNVRAHLLDEDVNVTLVEGKVNLQNNKGIVLTQLSTGENARFDLVDKTINVASVNTDFYTTWKEGYLVFKDETLDAIAAKLERWYNVKVVFDNESIKQLKYSGTILKNKPIDQVIDILIYIAGIDYSIEMIENKPSIIHLKNKPM